MTPEFEVGAQQCPAQGVVTALVLLATQLKPVNSTE